MASNGRNLSLVKKHLQSNESIITSIYGVYEKNDWTRKGILVATENRIIFFADKLIGFDLESFPFKSISSYEHSRNFMGHEIKFYASGNEVKIKWIRSSNLSSFNDYINSNLGQQHGTKEIVQIESVASQLEKLANLLEKELITEVEFYKMKHEITSDGQQKNMGYRQESIEEKILKSKHPENSITHNIKQKKKYKMLSHILIAGLIVFVYVKACDSPDAINDKEVVENNSPIYQYSKVNLNIRKHPNSKGKVLKIIKSNDKVITYDSIVNGFVMVLDDDSKEYGWASSKYLQKSPLSKKPKLETIRKKESKKKSNPNIFKYTILKEDKYEKIKKVNITVRLEKEMNKLELTKIGLEIKENRPNFEKFWIFYYLPRQKTGNGAWAITHFKPELEIEILGAINKDFKEMNEKKVTGTILNIWNDNDPMMPNKIYLVSENDKLFIKTIYAKTKYFEATEIIEEITETKEKGLIRYNYDNKHGEYYIVEKNGNLGLYTREGKFKESIKVK